MPTRLNAFKLIVSGPMTNATAIKSRLSGQSDADTDVVRNSRAALSGIKTTANLVNSAPTNIPTITAHTIRGTALLGPIMLHPPSGRFPCAAPLAPPIHDVG